MSDFRLTRIETQSQLWLKLKKHMQERVDVLRAKNDGDLDTTETARLRGRIAAIKELIALEDHSPFIVADEQQ